MQFQSGIIPLNELYSEEFASWLRRFMNTGAVPLGPAHLLSRPNSFMVAPFTNGAHLVLADDKGEIRTFFNACPHRRKTLYTIPDTNGWALNSFTGRLQSHIVCGGHSWGFTSRGEQAQHSQGCSGLTSAGTTRDIGGHLWVGYESALAKVSEILTLPLIRKHGINFTIPIGYRLATVKIDRAKYRPFTGLKVFGDVGHVDDAYHNRTLKRVTTVSGLEIDLSSGSGQVSVQIVPWNSICDYARTTTEWARWHAGVSKLQQENPHDPGLHRIVWMQDSRSGWTGEQFPGMYVDSRFMPDPSGVGTMNIVAFYFHEDILAFRDSTNDTDENGDIVHWATRAYWNQLAPEDAKLCAEEDEGCINLLNHGQGALTDGMYESYEEGISLQYETWLARQWKMYKERQEGRFSL